MASAVAAEEEERVALALAGAGDGVFDWDLVAGTLTLSAGWKAQLGFAADHDLGSGPEAWLGRVHPDDLAGLRAALDAHLDNATHRFVHEHRIRARDGEHRNVLARGLAARDGAGRAVRLVGTQTDVSVYKAAEARLQHDALHDPLTGLPNRALFLDRLELALRRALRRPKAPACAVLFIDLDRLKLVNDSLGHLAGDRLLQLVGARLAQAVRPGDTVARLGGDEFTVLLEALADASEAAAVADRVHEALGAPVVLEGRELSVTASIGIATAHVDSRAEDVLRNADAAMYRAKAAGPGRRATFDAGMRARVDVATALRGALDSNALALDHQPIAVTGSGRIVGVEARPRWPTPPTGIDAPDLLAVAEETGLAVPLGAWALDAACRRIARRRDRLTVSVDVTGAQLADPGFPALVARVLHTHGLAPTRLRLEVAERVLARDPDGTRRELERVERETGVRAHLDHFGAGTASLHALHRFPGNAIKLDRGFVAELAADDVLRAVITLARTLGLAVVAQGVDSPDQLARARRLGCDRVQGEAIGQPDAPVHT
jgi:diguanylate cyclase (GGDEF)-like protein